VGHDAPGKIHLKGFAGGRWWHWILEAGEHDARFTPPKASRRSIASHSISTETARGL
jgi:hypothetical protein